MNELNLKKLRLEQKISQNKLTNDLNLSQPSLSRLEQDMDKISYSLTEDYLKSLYLTVEDYIYLQKKGSHFEKMVTLLFENIDNPNYNDIMACYEYFNSNKKKSRQHLFELIKVKKCFAHLYPDSIPDFTKEEIEDVYNHIKELTHFSYVHYEFLDAFSLNQNASYALVEDMLKLMYFDYELNLCTCHERTKKNIVAILNNMIDRGLRQPKIDFTKLEFYYDELKKALTKVESASIKNYMPYLKILIDSRLEFNNENIVAIQKIIRAFRDLGQEELADSIQNDYIELIDKDYYPTMTRIVWT